MTPANAALDLPAADPLGDEIAGLEKRMESPRTSGWYSDEKAQARYRELITKREAAMPVSVAAAAAPRGGVETPGSPARALASDPGADAYGPLIAAELERDFGPAAGEINDALGGLGDGIRAAIRAELVNPYTPRLPPADRDQVQDFAQTGAGQILTREWGDNAGRKLAVILHRWDRLTANLTEREFAEIDDFYRHRLRAGERAAILRRLAF